MLKRILITWFVANFAIVGAVTWLAGGWYLGWPVGALGRAAAELALIMLPNLLLPILVLRRWQPEPVGSLREALGWQWAGWRSLLIGPALFLGLWFVTRALDARLGGGIPYQLPGASGQALTVPPGAVLALLGVLLALVGFVGLTVTAEETMFRGWIQTQVGKRYGAWIGLGLGVVLFWLRHLPADFFYAQLWQATPQMWLRRQTELGLAALGLGLARHFGKSTYTSALMHLLMLIFALFGLG